MDNRRKGVNEEILSLLRDQEHTFNELTVSDKLGGILGRNSNLMNAEVSLSELPSGIIELLRELRQLIESDMVVLERRTNDGQWVYRATSSEERIEKAVRKAERDFERLFLDDKIV